MFNFWDTASAFGLFVCLYKRLDGLVGMNGWWFFCFKVLKVVLDSSDMVFVDEMAKIIERRLLR